MAWLKIEWYVIRIFIKLFFKKNLNLLKKLLFTMIVIKLSFNH